MTATGNMAPFDQPALAAAKVEVAKINAKGGVTGRPLKIVTCDTQGNKPDVAKLVGAKLVDQKVDIIFTTCDVDYATPVVQESINAGLLTVAPCIGTDQMGPSRFGAKGKLAFSFGNVAQDEGSAMAQYAWNKGWKTAGTATNTLLVYFKDVVKAFQTRFTQLGGKIVSQATYTTGQNNVGNAVSQLNGAKADVIVTATSFGALPPFVTGLRSLGNQTPVLNSWAGDGTYWVTKAGVTNYYAVTYASAFGDDPNPAVNTLAKAVKAGTGGFVTGAAAIDGVVTAINRAGGSTNGAALAAQMEKFKKVPGISGLVSFSPPCTPCPAGTTASSRSPAPRRRSSARSPRRSFRSSPYTVSSAVARDRPGPPPAAGSGPHPVPIARTRCRRATRQGALRALSVSRSFQGVQALDDVTLELHRHEVVGLIGPNGAGKSTLVNLLTGFDAPTTGTIELDGRDITGWSAHRLARAGLARTFQHSHPFRSLSRARERRGRRARRGRSPRNARARADELLDLLGLEEPQDAPAGSLAHGDERRLGVARALAIEPAFVLMDEPAAGLPEAEVPEFAAVVRSVRDDHGAGVLLIDHNMALIMDVCDRIHVLDQGTTLAAGTPAEIRDNLDVASAYLGESAVHEEAA